MTIQTLQQLVLKISNHSFVRYAACYNPSNDTEPHEMALFISDYDTNFALLTKQMKEKGFKVEIPQKIPIGNVVAHRITFIITRTNEDGSSYISQL
jgi:hypothetical protein